jgi:phage baseplate assembly protein gpV
MGASIRYGQISTVNPLTGGARVAHDDMKDRDGNPVVSDEMQILRVNSTARKVFSLPEVGEPVVYITQENGNQIESFIVGFVNTASNMPDDGPDPGRIGLYREWFEDGHQTEYDLKEHIWRMKFHDGTEIEQDSVKKLTTVTFPDGTTVVYDADGSVLLVNAVNDVEILAGGDVAATADGNVTVTAVGAVTISAPSVIINGELKVNGSIHATGDMIDGGSNTNHHSH